MKPVNTTRPTVEIHPYVQGRLRALPRDGETAGILLGNSSDGVTRITGFKRVPSGSLREAAGEAGAALTGYYRLQRAGVPELSEEEEDLLRTGQEGNLFLLVKAVGGGVEATAWKRPENGEPAAEPVSLDSRPRERREAPVLRVRMASPAAPRGVLVLAAAVLAVAAWWVWPLPERRAPELAIELKSRPGELTAVWVERSVGDREMKSAKLVVQDGAREQTMDLTRTYTPRGQVTVRPRGRDVVLTLTVEYTDGIQVTRSATYTGFVAGAAAPSEAELAALRKRNKELREALDALKKHVLP